MKSAVLENKTAPRAERDAGDKNKPVWCDCTTTTPAATKGEPVRAADGKIIGRVIGDVFVKVCEERKHMLRTPQSWSCDITALRQAQCLGARYIEIHAKDTHKTYTAPLASFWSRGIRLDRGFGEQLALQLTYWTVTTENEPPARQLQLFSEVA
jgi:hypothetical protein